MPPSCPPTTLLRICRQHSPSGIRIAGSSVFVAEILADGAQALVY